MGGIAHDALGLSTLARESSEGAVEHVEPAPSAKEVVERLMRAIRLGRVFPLEDVADHIANTAVRTPILDALNDMRQREIRRNPRHLLFVQKNK